MSEPSSANSTPDRRPGEPLWGYAASAMFGMGGAASLAVIGGVERAGWIAAGGFISAAIFVVALELSRKPIHS